MKFEMFRVDSPEYEQMVALRMEALLEPIGIPESYIDREREKEDMLVGAFEDEQIIGCFIFTPIDSTTVQLRQMAVKPGRQKAGIGSSLMEFAQKMAQGVGYSTIVLHAREQVIGFYSKFGFSTEGERFEEVGIGHYKMRKTLESVKKQP